MAEVWCVRNRLQVDITVCELVLTAPRPWVDQSLTKV